MELGNFNLINIFPSKSQFLPVFSLISERARMTQKVDLNEKFHAYQRSHELWKTHNTSDFALKSY